MLTYAIWFWNNDPDENFSKESQFTDTNYFSTEEPILRISRTENNSFSLLSLNTRSIQNKNANLIVVLAISDFEFKVICISETWCSENLSNS